MPTPSSALPKPRLSRGSYLDARKNPRCVWGCSASTFTHGRVVEKLEVLL